MASGLVGRPLPEPSAAQVTTEAIRREALEKARQAKQPTQPKPAPRPFTMDPELAEIEALLLA
jgi:hypothetical protein